MSAQAYNHRGGRSYAQALVQLIAHDLYSRGNCRPMNSTTP